jgi:hypothetical protein
MKNRSITVQGAEVAITTRHEQDYISLTDMVKSFEGGSALIEQWLKNKDTVLFLGVWDQINNSAFNSLEFEGIRNEAGRNSFYLSARSGSRPQAPSACTPRPAGTGERMPTATLPSNSAPGSVPSSSCTSSRSFNGSRMGRHARHRWNGTSSVRYPKSTTASTRTRSRKD